jgi:four helix bundle protein
MNNLYKFKKLRVWQKAMLFISKIYKVSCNYPVEEKYGLTDQIRRASTSIALNIAEGSGCGGDKEFARFLHISLRSLYEVVTGIEIAINLGYGSKLDNNELLTEVDELGAMIQSLIQKLMANSQ